MDEATNQNEITNSQLLELERPVIQYGTLAKETRQIFANEGAKLFATITYMVKVDGAVDGLKDMTEAGRTFAALLRDISPHLAKVNDEDYMACLFGMAMEAVSISRMQLAATNTVLEKVSREQILGGVEDGD